MFTCIYGGFMVNGEAPKILFTPIEIFFWRIKRIFDEGK